MNAGCRRGWWWTEVMLPNIRVRCASTVYGIRCWGMSTTSPAVSTSPAVPAPVMVERCTQVGLKGTNQFVTCTCNWHRKILVHLGSLFRHVTTIVMKLEKINIMFEIQWHSDNWVTSSESTASYTMACNCLTVSLAVLYKISIVMYDFLFLNFCLHRVIVRNCIEYLTELLQISIKGINTIKRRL